MTLQRKQRGEQINAGVWKDQVSEYLEVLFQTSVVCPRRISSHLPAWHSQIPILNYDRYDPAFGEIARF